MAKQLAFYKTELAAVKKELEAVEDAIDRSGSTRTHHEQMIEQGARFVGDRVRELREAGHAGQTIDDFKDDDQVKRMLAEMELHLTQIDKDITQLKAQSAEPWKNSIARYNKLQRDLMVDIAERKKALSTKVGLGNKSLPDMQKLLLEVNDFALNKQVVTTRDYVTTKPALKNPGSYRKERDRLLALELAKSKGKALSQAQADLFERLLTDRIFIKYGNRVRTLTAGVLKSVGVARTAIEARQAKQLMAAKVEAAHQMKELDDIVKQYEAARKVIGDDVIRESKAGGKLMEGLKQMALQRDKARNELRQVANVRLDQ